MIQKLHNFLQLPYQKRFGLLAPRSRKLGKGLRLAGGLAVPTDCAGANNWFGKKAHRYGRTIATQ
jgi:hypothetical protein